VAVVREQSYLEMFQMMFARDKSMGQWWESVADHHLWFVPADGLVVPYETSPHLLLSLFAFLTFDQI
jgi:hypothetical protein